jgi:hypothetical protein
MWHFIVTLRHTRGDDQRQNVERFLTALDALTASRFWRRYVPGYLLKVEIEGELTRSGLHPHAHVVLVLNDNADVNAYTFATMAQAAFLKELVKIGGSAAWGDPLTNGWFKPVTDARNLPAYLAKKGFPRWDIADELCSSQAKNGGFWTRKPEDLALCNAYTAGVRLLRSGGIFRTALAHARKQQEAHESQVLTPIISIPAEAWTARPDLREPVLLLAEDPTLSPEWVAEIVNELFDLTPLEGARFLLQAFQDGAA